jgi:hypothetical protein
MLLSPDATAEEFTQYVQAVNLWLDSHGDDVMTTLMATTTSHGSVAAA